MAEDLRQRLNDRGYTNWLKAGRCLLLLNRGLRPFTDEQMSSFHAELLSHNRRLRSACRTKKCRGSKLISACDLCSEWKAVILKHHRQPDCTIYWDNCFPPAWRTNYWEVAKAYMPRGQGKVKGLRECDVSALLNLINFCDYFQSVNPRVAREVIRFRNELMHSGDMEVKDQWMRRFWATLREFLAPLGQLPCMWSVEHDIKQMLALELSLSVHGLDKLDNDLSYDTIVQQCWTPTESNVKIISKWEAVLLRERLQELLRAAEDEDAETRDPRQLERMGGFLQANRDLRERFSAELQAIASLQATQGHRRASSSLTTTITTFVKKVVCSPGLIVLSVCLIIGLYACQLAT